MDPVFALPIALQAMLAVIPVLAQGEADEFTALDNTPAAPLARRAAFVDANARSGGSRVGGPTLDDPLRGTLPPPLEAADTDAVVPVAAKHDVLDWVSPVFVWVEPGYAYAEGTVTF